MPTTTDSSKPSADVATAGWSGLTARIAWTLLSEGVRVRPQVLRDSRDHVLFHLEQGLSIPSAEDRAGELTSAFIARARRRTNLDPWPQDAAMPLSPRWKRAIDHSLNQITAWVFRHHYGDGRSLEQLERVIQVDRLTLEAARGGLREVLRRAGVQDGLPFDLWPTVRLDRLLRRLASWAPGPCPTPFEVVEGHHREHISSCIRCERIYRLVRHGILSVADLMPPVGGARPGGRVKVLALHLHPEARQHRARLLKESPVPAFPYGEDLLFFDDTQPDKIKAFLQLVAEVGVPGRDMLRGAIIEAPGRWSSLGLLGPAADQAETALRSKNWGQIEGVKNLPTILPQPPSARRWWIAVAGIATLGFGAAGFALTPGSPSVAYPLNLQFSPGRGGIWIAFDVDELAHVAVIAQAGDRMEVILDGKNPTEKAVVAVGDGSYRLHTQADAVLVVSTNRPLDDLSKILEATSGVPASMEQVAERIHTVDPTADLRYTDESGSSNRFFRTGGAYSNSSPAKTASKQ